MVSLTRILPLLHLQLRHALISGFRNARIRVFVTTSEILCRIKVIYKCYIIYCYMWETPKSDNLRRSGPNPVPKVSHLGGLVVICNREYTVLFLIKGSKNIIIKFVVY